MPVRALALHVARVRRMHVELNRQTLRDEVLDCETPRQLDPILDRDLGVRRQREHDLAGKLGVLAALRCFGRVPQHGGCAEHALAPSGSSTSWCSGASRCLK